MLSEERRREILEMLRNDGRVLGARRTLRKHFRTSQRSPFAKLFWSTCTMMGSSRERAWGALQKETGTLRDSPLEEKARQHRQEKMRIAAAAAQKIHKGQVIILDSGTTTTAIARSCREIKNLTIITNATNIAAELADSSVEVILTGGVRFARIPIRWSGRLPRNRCESSAPTFSFFGVDGFDVHYGLTTPNLLEARVNRAMAESARRTVVVCDSSEIWPPESVP